MHSRLRSAFLRNRTRIESDMRDSWKRRFLSPASLGLYAKLIPALNTLARGAALDAGCGTMPFRRILERHVTEYHCLDHEQRAAEVTFLADIQTMEHVPAGRYDIVLCSEVLEHLPLPEQALTSINRVLKSGGRLVLTVPFLSRLHEEPNDYFRYTSHGLRLMLERNGFMVEQLEPVGSLFTFLGHQISTGLVVGTYGIPVVKQLIFWLNVSLIVLPCYWLDRLSGLGRILPSGYLAVAAKPRVS